MSYQCGSSAKVHRLLPAVLLALILLSPAILLGQSGVPRIYSVEVSASVFASPARITLNWPADSTALDPANVRAVFLFGRVPVPYSGDIAPDGHLNHKGAWPADVYYGEMDGLWTDSSVNTTNSERQINWNRPGDGKFDQSVIPSDVDLEVGRVDMANLTSFSNKTPPRSERDLLRQYLPGMGC